MMPIPSFYKRAKDQSPETAALASKASALARKRFLTSKAEELFMPDEELEHLHRTIFELSENPFEAYMGATPSGELSLGGKMLTSDTFLSLRDRPNLLNVRLRNRLFTPEMFFLFPRDISGRIYSAAVLSFVREYIEVNRIRLDLAELDTNNEGHLNEVQLVAYFNQFAQGVPEETLDVYLAVVVRKVMFFLEQNGRVSIKSLMASHVLLEFRTRDRDPKSWFNSQNVLTMYELFRFLDRDQNGFLSQDEMTRFQTLDEAVGADSLPRVSPVFVRMLFASKVFPSKDNPDGELDFRRFLDFVLAFGSKSNQVSLRYYWEILCGDQQGHLDSKDLTDLIASVFDTAGKEFMYDTGIGDIKVKDVVNEIFDMINGGKADVISFDDLIKSNHGSTILNMLTDPWAFFEYERREAKLANQNQTQDQQYFENEESQSLDYSQAASAIFGPGSEGATSEPIMSDPQVDFA